MGTQERIGHEINLIELFWDILFGWRQIICFGVICAVLLGGVKYIKDGRVYRTAQNTDAVQKKIELTAEEEEQVENAMVMINRIESYQKYLDESALMQINPYEKPIVELQYYIQSDYTYNYTKDNQSDYTSDLMALYYNYVRSGEMSNKVIETAKLSVSQADFSELCSVSLNGSTMVISITWAEEEKLDVISDFIKSELSRKEVDFQEVGSHKLKLLRESQNVIADTDLAEKKNLIANNIVNINTQLNNLKLSMSDQQLELLRSGNELESEGGKETIENPPVFNFKYMVLGAIFGIMVVCIWIVCKKIFTVKLQISEEIRTFYNTRIFGEVIVQSQKKRCLSAIDDKLLAIKNRRKKKLSMDQQIKLIAANIVLSCKQQGIDCIYMTGSEYENMDVAVLSRLKKELAIQDVRVKEGGNIFYDAESLKMGTEIGNILFVEQTGLSIYDEISNELNLAKEQNNHILGFVVLI